jgi:predicted regulator of Ras-like GTPase activity (Roadblock/LC7/MglB family)
LVVTPELASVKLTVQKNDKAKAALLHLSAMEGVLACAVVSDETSKILARDSSLGADLDLDQAAAACAKLMQAHRESASCLGLTSVDELTTTSGDRQIMMRPASKRPGVFMMALLDKQRTNMTLARLKLIEIDRHLS